MTAKVVTWLGEDVEFDDAAGEAMVSPGPSFNMWQTIRFDKGKGVLIDDEQGAPEFRALKTHILATAPSNQFYLVEDPVEHKGKATAHEAKPPPPPPAPKPRAGPRR